MVMIWPSFWHMNRLTEWWRWLRHNFALSSQHIYNCFSLPTCPQYLSVYLVIDSKNYLETTRYLSVNMGFYTIEIQFISCPRGRQWWSSDRFWIVSYENYQTRSSLSLFYMLTSLVFRKNTHNKCILHGESNFVFVYRNTLRRITRCVKF